MSPFLSPTSRWALLLFLCMSAADVAHSKPSAESGQETCILTDANLAQNARLSFEDFDQNGTTAATARQLGDRGCFEEAARATQHYLIHGPVLTSFQRDVVTWHLGQYLALAGDETTAARLMATTRHPIPPDQELDWNNYVVGTWAFLVKDKELLEQSIAALWAGAPRNANNAAALERLFRCFNRSYKDAFMGEECRSD